VRVKMLALIVCIGWSGALMAGQTKKVSTPEDLSEQMKKVGPANEAITKALPAGNFAEVRTQLAIIRQAVAASENFWVEHKRDDAVKFTKDALTKLDAFAKTVEGAAPDAAAAGTASRELGAACRSCHMTYRDRDEAGKYRIKPGSLGGGLVD
jgi:cytochrome c556